MSPSFTYIDIHSHLNFPDYDTDREEVITRMKEQGVATIIIGTSLSTSTSAVELASKHDNLFACIGIHPIDESFDDDSVEKAFIQFEELVKHPKVVAIGECGLDYGKEGEVDEQTKQSQERLFEKHVHFAVAHNKPIMIHARNSHDDILDMLESFKTQYGKTLRGNAHFFTGTIEQAKRYAKLDFSVSFTGVITFVKQYESLVKELPLEMMMSETDAPFVSPVPYRGKRNEPTYVIEVVKKIALLRNQSEEEVACQLLSNAVAKFGLVW